MRRTLAALEVSVVSLKTPISAVERTCVPPHSSRDQLPSPTSTIRTTSPYFSPNSAIAPRLLRLVERGGERAHRIVGEHVLVDAVLDPRHVLVAQRRAVGEVEAQLVGADVGAGLAHVRRRAARAAPRAAGGWRCGWPGWRAGRAASTVAMTRSPSCSSPLVGSSTSAWSSPRRTTSSTRAAQRPSSQRMSPHVGDLAAAGRVEGRLDELREHARRP